MDKLSKKRASAHSAQILIESTAASHGCVQKLGNKLQNDFELCSQIRCNNAIGMKCLKPKLIPALAQRVFEQSATENTHILCYWQTIHNSISKICPVFKFSALTFLRSMSCSMSIELKLCKERNFQLQSMSHAISSIDKLFVARILVYRVWPWYST